MEDSGNPSHLNSGGLSRKPFLDHSHVSSGLFFLGFGGVLGSGSGRFLAFMIAWRLSRRACPPSSSLSSELDATARSSKLMMSCQASARVALDFDFSLNSASEILAWFRNSVCEGKSVSLVVMMGGGRFV